MSEYYVFKYSGYDGRWAIVRQTKNLDEAQWALGRAQELTAGDERNPLLLKKVEEEKGDED